MAMPTHHAQALVLVLYPPVYLAEKVISLHGNRISIRYEKHTVLLYVGTTRVIISLATSVDLIHTY
jgi:hypothetical protein